VKTGKNQNSPAQIKTRKDFYDWLAQEIKIIRARQVSPAMRSAVVVMGAIPLSGLDKVTDRPSAAKGFFSGSSSCTSHSTGARSSRRHRDISHQTGIMDVREERVSSARAQARVGADGALNCGPLLQFHLTFSEMLICPAFSKSSETGICSPSREGRLQLQKHHVSSTWRQTRWPLGGIVNRSVTGRIFMIPPASSIS